MPTMSTKSNGLRPAASIATGGLTNVCCELIGDVGTRVILEGTIDPVDDDWFPIVEYKIESGETFIVDQRVVFARLIRYRFIAANGVPSTLPTLELVPDNAVFHFNIGGV